MVIQRERKIKSGPLLEADFYPIWENGSQIPARPPKSKPSTKEQAAYNKRQAEKKLIRLVNANFGTDDYFLHPTYSPSNAPQSEKQAKKDMVNYIRRIKTRRNSEVKKTEKEIRSLKDALRKLSNNEYLEVSLESLKKKLKKLSEPLKYIYVIETQIYKSGLYAGLVNYHFHLFITGGLSNREMERMWHDGIRTNCNNFQPDKFGPEAAAKYISKDPKGTKRFVCSRNLRQPQISKPKDGKISRRGVEKIAKERANDKEYWEKRYKGYRFIRCSPRYNEYNGYWYVSVVMYKSNTDPPQWRTDRSFI